MRFDPPCRIHPSSGGAFCGQPGRGAPWSRRQLARRQRKGPGRTAPRHPEKPARQPTAQSPPPGRVHGNAGSPVYSLRHNVAGGGSPRLRPSRRNFGRADTAPQPIRGGYRPRNSHRCFRPRPLPFGHSQHFVYPVRVQPVINEADNRDLTPAISLPDNRNRPDRQQLNTCFDCRIIHRHGFGRGSTNFRHRGHSRLHPTASRC